MENAALDLGFNFTIELTALVKNRADYTVQQLITALEETTYLAKLTVRGPDMCEPLSIQRVVEPLCRCLASLRLQNEHLPLREISFHWVRRDIVRQFLVAMKQFGIREVIFRSTDPFPVHWLVDFCHDNSNLKVLDLNLMDFTDEVVADPIGGSASTTSLESLILNHLTFHTSFAATNFAHFVAHMSVSRLELGILVADNAEDLVTKRILSEFKMPSVESLTLPVLCTGEHFQAALHAGMATLIDLFVDLSPGFHVDNTTEKLESLIRMIRGAVKLRILCFIYGNRSNPMRPPRELCQVLEACSSVLQIKVDIIGNPYYFTEPEKHQLNRISVRNIELCHFMADPPSFPNAKLLNLMPQFNDCPSGLYRLTRRLPEVFSFAKGHSLFHLMVEPNPTPKLSKRRKNSYK